MCFLACILPAYSQFTEESLNSSNGDRLGFLQYKPAEYNQDVNTKYPIIIFLHGIGERGDGTTQLRNVTCCGLPRIIKLGHKMRFTWNGKTETFLVLAPQCPTKYGMWPAIFVEELIKYAKQNLRIDPDRIFLTGLSMGGGGTYRFISTAAENPLSITAAATIAAPCTFSNGKYVADAKLPLWSFHAADDPTASVTCTEAAITKINAAHPEVVPLKTIWPTGGHIVWDRVYTDTSYKYDGILNIYEWFLGQNRKLPINKLPKADAGSDLTTTTGTGVVTLDATRSFDTDGKLVRYVWKKISGPSAGVITNAFGPNSSTTVTGLSIPGTYQYQLAVVDDRASFDKDTISVVVNGGNAVSNKAPVAKAGTDLNLTLPVNTATLNGSGSFDEDGYVASYAWTKVSGPGVTIGNPKNVSASISGLLEGTYSFKLTVTDNKGVTSEDLVTIVVNPAIAPVNVVPVAKAGTDLSITLPENTVKLDGSASSDKDGSIAAYGWTKVSGPSLTFSAPGSAITNLNGLVEGVYSIKLTVTDDKGAKSDDIINITVKPAPAPSNIDPVANAGNDITITLPLNKTTLDGSGSTDADGTIKSYLWSRISGPAQYKIADPAAAKTAFSNLVEGVYVMKLVVTDNSGATHQDVVDITVKARVLPPNILPVSKAGNDVTIMLPINKVTLNGNGSTDEDGTISSYSWSKVDGPSHFLIVNPNAANTGINNLEEGVYQFRLRVIDNRGGTSDDTIKVTVNPAPPPVNLAPVAQAGSNKTITLPANSVTLNGNTSTDADGTITKYTWSFVSGPGSYSIANAALAVTNVSGLTEGSYYFRLLVEDNDGATDADTLIVKVNAALTPEPPANVAPVARAGNDVIITLPEETTQLVGTGSGDEDGTIISYSWTKISGPSQFEIADHNSSVTDVQRLTEGEYAFRLEIKDNDGGIASDTVIVTVIGALNVAPLANAGSDFAVSMPDPFIQLDGLGSNDPDGAIATYNWTRISGSGAITIVNSTTATPTVIGVQAGEYVFELTVTDEKGLSSTDQVTVTVGDGSGDHPLAGAGEDQFITSPENKALLNGGDSYDANGRLVSYSWKQVSGPSTATLLTPDEVITEALNLEVGEYVFTLTVIDNDGGTSTDKITIKVTSPVSNLRFEQQVNVYPNPARSSLNVQFSSDTTGKARITIYDITGVGVHTMIKEKTQYDFNQNLNINDLKAGVYYMEIVIGDKLKLVKKFIKQN
ncbi:MAG: PKD domain-containing protein [Flavitalea sp.]